jgi:membrane protease YdiL (CAAX protease family)
LDFAANASSAPSKTKRVLVVWAGVASYFTILSIAASRAGSSGTQQIPTSFSLSEAISIIGSALIFFVPVMFFLVYSIRHYEKGSLRSATSSLGLNSRGIGRSLLWSIVFMALLSLAIILWEGVMVGIFGSSFETAQTLANQIPRWYAVVIMFNLVLNAVMEESVGRGYMLDRLMLSHPAGLLASLPAILGVSLLGVLYHVPEYFLSYNFSPLSALYNLVVVFLSFAFLGLAYVRSRVRNISGPILVHFLLDAIPYFMIVA